MAAKGMGGPGGFDMNALLKQAQKMQENVKRAQDEIARVAGNDQHFGGLEHFLEPLLRLEAEILVADR